MENERMLAEQALKEAGPKRAWMVFWLLFSLTTSILCFIYLYQLLNKYSYYEAEFLKILAGVGGILSLLSMIIPLAILCESYQKLTIKNIEFVDHKLIIHYYKNTNGKTEIEKLEIAAKDIILKHEIGQNGIFFREGDTLILSEPEDFKKWWVFLKDAKAKAENKRLEVLLASSQTARILPPEPPQLALESTQCNVCNEAMGPDRPLVMCAKCQTPHHKDCWAYIGKCSTYNCGATDYQ